MKPQQLAKLLSISPSTLRLWAGKEYVEFLSPSAQGPHGAARAFSNRDARILAWVALLRTSNTAIDDIKLTLRSAQAENWRNLPELPGAIADDEPVAMVPREAVEERVKALQERFETQLRAVVEERDRLITERNELKAKLDVEREARQTTAEHLQQRINELTAREAELRGELKQYAVGGRRLPALVLAAVVALVVIAVMLVLFLVLR